MGRWILHDPPDDPSDLGDEPLALNIADNLAGLYPRAEIQRSPESPGPRGIQIPVLAVTGDLDRFPGVGIGLALCDDPTQVRTAVCFDDQMCLDPGRKAGTQADDESGIGDPRRAAFLLAKAGVNDHLGVQRCEDALIGTGGHRDRRAGFEESQDPFQGRGMFGGHTVQRDSPLVYRRRVRHPPTHGEWLRRLENHHRIPGREQTMCRRRSDVVTPTNDHTSWRFLIEVLSHWYLVWGEVCRFACRRRAVASFPRVSGTHRVRCGAMRG